MNRDEHHRRYDLRGASRVQLQRARSWHREVLRTISRRAEREAWLSRQMLG